MKAKNILYLLFFYSLFFFKVYCFLKKKYYFNILFYKKERHETSSQINHIKYKFTKNKLKKYFKSYMKKKYYSFNFIKNNTFYLKDSTPYIFKIDKKISIIIANKKLYDKKNIEIVNKDEDKVKIQSNDLKNGKKKKLRLRKNENNVANNTNNDTVTSDVIKKEKKKLKNTRKNKARKLKTEKNKHNKILDDNNDLNNEFDSEIEKDKKNEIENEEENEKKKIIEEEKEKEKLERQKKIEFIKKVEFLLKEDEKNESLYEKRPDIDKLRFGDKPPPACEDLMSSILRNIHDKGFKEKTNTNEMCDLRKKHIFYELLRISNSNTFKTHKIYKHNDLIYGMKYRKLGDSNLCVSEICIGTNMYENENFISKDDVNVLLNMAFYEYGINFFDICEYDPFPFDPESYKKSKNKNMNLFLKDKKRENIIINLRMCSSRNVDKITHGDYYLSWIMEDLKDDTPNFYNIEERLDKILKNLNTNYVDILTIDIPERYIPNSVNGEDTYVWGFENLRAEENKEVITIEEQFEILEKLVLKGKVRHIAVSNESVWGIYQWCNLAKKKKKKNMKIVCVQNLYNLLHRNEVESSGLVEMILKENYDVPLVPYGLLAGGILTGKYLDPERYHTMGPDTILGDDQLDHDLDDSRGNKPEDYGYLSYGPRNGRCNKYPLLYKSHRCVWAQDAVGEYIKLARSHGMSLAQLSLSYVYSRPFVGSSIIGPRTIGQLKDSVLSLNYPIYQHTECDIHEIFLRYRGCTMDGNTILNSLSDPNKTSQSVFYKTANIPILSGGTFWNNYPLPPLLKRYEYMDMKEEHDRIKSTFGLNDEPNDHNFISSRMWVEREKRKGEYYALKESILFKWNKYKLYKGMLTKLNKKEQILYDTSNFHFAFKNDTISVIPTDDEIKNFYENQEKIKKVIHKTVNDHQELFQYHEYLGSDLPSIFNNLDIDLIYKQLLNRHNINPLDKNELDSIYEYIKLTPSEIKTEDYWYIYKYNPFDTSFSFRTGTEP
ncbi:aldo-keto reductase, putative [Plasmodium gallinaceum]|uniref:Aldo-keto reductase, putative n=1 Tax=Plasmodium gallinaceum TaxID=5849 RepID=A0A1J1GT04_PLAGA|nr:aldo-keto reductase, putative [Plasmodium gallinaceum]CRG95610.1 aldo-keto reductase, putative [Plasmodium gallinaceum]